MPKNEEDDYSQNFKLSLREFAKALEDKTLVAPLIIYNSDLDIPLDMEQEIEKYVFYTDKDGLATLIKKQETTDYFRCLILHGFDISLDEVRDVYCSLSRRNEADVCINVVQELDHEGLSFKENLTFYLRNDLDQCSDEEWEDDKKSIEDDMEEYINEWLSYDDLSEEDMMELLPYLMSGDLDEFDRKIEEKRKKVPSSNKKEEKKDDNKIIHIPLPTESSQKEEKDANMCEKPIESQDLLIPIQCYFDDGKSIIMITKFNDDEYLIEDDDFEIKLNLDKMNFLMESFERIKNKQNKKK
jgi:hypothetical protein